MSILKYGLIGCGSISRSHLNAAVNNELEIVAICDLHPEALDIAVTSFSLNNTRKYTDYKEMLDKEKLDLVAITTSSSHHAIAALDCISAGAHIIIEKPIALSLSDADKIISESHIRNLKVCVSHQNRLNDSVQKTRKAIEGGNLGKLTYAAASIRWNRTREYYAQAPWRGTWKEDGGALMNQCIHNIDILRWIMGGEITEVFAYTDQLVHKYIEAEDFGIAVIKFANGSYGILDGTTSIYSSNFEETLCVFGTEGIIKLGGKSLKTIEHWQVKGSEEIACISNDSCSKKLTKTDVSGHTLIYQDMIEAIAADRKPYIDAEEGRNAIELVLAIYESSLRGKPIRLPYNEGKTVDYIGRF